MRIKLSGIFVDDQDKARAFYTDVLGFTVKNDAQYTETERWLSVVSPDDPDGPELLLGLPTPAGLAFQKESYDAGKPFTILVTKDVQSDYERLVGLGVTFTMPPTTMPYGGTDALFDDTCGNLICLHQDWGDR